QNSPRASPTDPPVQFFLWKSSSSIRTLTPLHPCPETLPSRPGRLQHAPHDLRRQRLRLSLQTTLRRVAVLQDVSFRCLHLGLGFVPLYSKSSVPCLQRCFAPGLLRSEHCRPRLAQPLLVLGRALLSR